MKTVNLLPKWYRQQQRQKRNLRAHLGAMVLVGAGMVAAAALGEGRIVAVRAERARFEQALSKVADPEPDLLQKRAELRRLENLQLAYRELGKTIPMSAVIQQLQNEMTAGMALARVDIEVRSDPLKGSGLVGDARNPPRYHDVAYLSLEGISPNDKQIFQMIEKLSANPLFSDVTLDYTRTGTLQNFLVRRFEIRIRMDLDRLMTDPAAAGESKKVAFGGPGHGE